MPSDLYSKDITFEEAVLLVMAGDLVALFGADEDEAPKRFKALSLVLHPDRVHRDGAEKAFARLTALWQKRNGTDPVVITTKRRSYRFDGEAARGDLATLFFGRNLGAEESVVVKMVRSPKNSDLMKAEAEALKALKDFTWPEAADGVARPMFPTLIESFRHRDAETKAMRQVNVLAPLFDFVDLEAVVAANGGPLDPRDGAWMFRRLLHTLGVAHQAGFIHGAVIPSNVMIHAEQHGLVPVDWCYSVPVDPPTQIKAAIPRFMKGKHYSWYPPEVSREKAPATPATDIYMAARLLEWLIAPRTPKEERMFGAFVRGCCMKHDSRRPQDAWLLIDEFDDLIERLWGPRKFREFVTPAPVVVPLPA